MVPVVEVEREEAKEGREGSGGGRRGEVGIISHRGTGTGGTTSGVGCGEVEDEAEKGRASPGWGERLGLGREGERAGERDDSRLMEGEGRGERCSGRPKNPLVGRGGVLSDGSNAYCVGVGEGEGEYEEGKDAELLCVER